MRAGFAPFRLLAALFALIAIACIAPSAGSALETAPEKLVVETAGGPVSFSVEIADTAAERSTGLMNRAEMAPDHGMLFVFGQPRPIQMWMKNTILPLDMIFIGADGRVSGIAAETVPFSETIIPSPGAVAYVLEINAGKAAESGIAPGDRVRHPAIAPQ